MVWERFGSVVNYVEPFFGSGAVLLQRPEVTGTETVNDADGLLANFWRALQVEPERVAEFADHPVNENDLHARHAWLVGRKESLQARLEGDPDFHDAKMAGWWAWGMCCWIGSGWCSGNGPWHVEDGRLVHVGSDGQGVNKIERKRHVMAGNAGGSVLPKSEALLEWFGKLSERLRKVRVCCGDWSRVMGPSVTTKHGLTAVFLDPPYADTAKRAEGLYRKDCGSVAHEVREWAVANGGDRLLRIALCGYEGEHKMPADWECVAWKAPGGYSSQSKKGNANCRKERIWFSPHCKRPRQEDLL